MSNDIENALKFAHYRDALIVTIENNSVGSNQEEVNYSEHVLVATLDKVSGGIRWVDANLESPFDVGIQRHLQTKQWFLPMLKDSYRNKLYDSAIQLACQELLHLRTEHDHCVIRTLDIGSGTGLLAMITARHMTSLLQQRSAVDHACGVLPNIEVTSIEMSSAMARLASGTIKENTFPKHDPSCEIQILEGHSCHVTFPNTFQLCTSELLESGLLGEGVLPAIRDAWERHLDADAIIVPQRARIYARVVEGRYSVGDFSFPTVLPNGIRLSSSTDSLGCIVPVHAEAFFTPDCHLSFHTEERFDPIKPLSQTILAFDFDFTTKINLPPLARSIHRPFVASESGVAHGILFWWECDLYGKVTYSTEPGKCPWQDHWLQCFFAFSQDHDHCQLLTEGEEYVLICSHNESKVSFELNKYRKPENDVGGNDVDCVKRQKLNIENTMNPFQSLMTPVRSLQLNCRQRHETIQRAIQYAIMLTGRDASFLDLSDFSLCSLIAALCSGATKVTSIESSLGHLPLFSATAAQVHNNLPKSSSEFVILNAHAESILPDHIAGGPAQIACSEPYYQVLEGWHLQEALNYFFLLKAMKLSGVVQNNAVCIPNFAILMGCAIELDPSFLDSYTGVNDLLGFNHKDVHRYSARLHEYDLVFPLWQYKGKKLTTSFEVVRIQYDGSGELMTIKGDHVWVSCPFIDVGACSAFAYWVEYHLAVSDGTYMTISTGDHYHQQAVRMLPEPTLIGPDKTFEVRFSVSTNECNDYSWEFKCQE